MTSAVVVARPRVPDRLDQAAARMPQQVAVSDGVDEHGRVEQDHPRRPRSSSSSGAQIRGVRHRHRLRGEDARSGVSALLDGRGVRRVEGLPHQHGHRHAAVGRFGLEPAVPLLVDERT